MIRINLLPLKETQRALGQRQQISVALLSLSVAALLMVIPYVMQGRTLSRLDTRMDELESEIRQLSEQTKEAADLDRKTRELKAKLRVIDELNQKRIGPVRVLDGLSMAAPEKLWLVDFTEVGGAATITGMALDNQTVAAFMRQLSLSRFFHSVDLVEATQSNPQRNQGEVRGQFMKFILKARIDYVGRVEESEPAKKGSGSTEENP